jgi:hypothetical protein
VPDSDPLCAANCSTTTTYYDSAAGANLLLISPDQEPNNTLWDLELNNRRSFYFHPSAGDCFSEEMSSGILRRDWLVGATALGCSMLNGRAVFGWTKADFIDFFVDALDCRTPVRWYFHTMKTTFNLISYHEGHTIPDRSMFIPPAYCPISNTTHLSSRLCKGKCAHDCKVYRTPLSECYSPSALFPGDEQWGAFDVFDVLDRTAGNDNFSRTFFNSTDGTCRGQTDGFTLPLRQCVGPFGAPRPWGTITQSVTYPPKVTMVSSDLSLRKESFALNNAIV